ncbi:hypothetical protein GCM10023189_16060 [Nibrella saemangeumensis]|uniref:DUF937 domain-containing protein n=1 Tax=Nibrella saemangeumensis TaxID=1084526 RepID=A0ABP8MPW8_9BACT
MATTTLEPIKALFTSAVINKLSPRLDEKPENVRKALDLLIPSVTGAVTSRAEGDGLTKLFNWAKTWSQQFDLSYLAGHDEARQKVTDQGRQFLESLVGPPVSGLINTASASSGVMYTSAAGLMGLVGATILSFLHNQIEKKQLTKAQIGDLLLSENERIAEQVPNEVNVAVPDLLVEPGGDLTSKNTSKPPAPVKMQLPRKDFDRMFLRLIGLILLLVMLLDTVRTCSETKEKKAQVSQETTYLHNP